MEETTKREELPAMLHKALLACGLVSSLLYGAMNVIGAMQFEGYSSLSGTISELSAIGAPSRPLWVVLGLVYGLLFIAFAWGVFASASGNRPLRIVGMLLFAFAGVSLLWQFAPMHLRGTPTTFTDTMHIVFAIVVVPLILTILGFGAASFGRAFRLYSIGTLLVVFGSGAWSGVQGPRVAANLPTPWLGLVERVCVFGFVVWVAVLAIRLLATSAHPAQKKIGTPTMMPHGVS